MATEVARELLRGVQPSKKVRRFLVRDSKNQALFALLPRDALLVGRGADWNWAGCSLACRRGDALLSLFPEEEFPEEFADLGCKVVPGSAMLVFLHLRKQIAHPQELWHSIFK